MIILLALLLMMYKIEGITLRNDNGSKFIAGVVRQFLKHKGVNQEFTQVATLEECAYIEAVHSNVQREVVERYDFESIYHEQMIFNRSYEWYNNHRKHGGLNRKSPEHYLRENDPTSGPYKTEKISDIVLNFNSILSKIKGRQIIGFYKNEKANNKNSINNLSNNLIFGCSTHIYC